VLWFNPDARQYLFGLELIPKDIAYSGREVVMKNNSFAPKKKHQSLDWCLLLFIFCHFDQREKSH
jgi:hypothetical protein